MAILAVFSINANYFLDFFNIGLTPHLIFLYIISLKKIKNNFLSF